MSDSPKKDQPASTFGVFNPVGFVALAFAASASATSARGRLLAGGFDAADVIAYSGVDVIANAEAARPHQGILSFLAEEREAADAYETLAKAGSSFLLVRAPSDDDAARVMNVVRRFGVQRAEHYGELTFTDLR